MIHLNIEVGYGNILNKNWRLLQVIMETYMRLLDEENKDVIIKNLGRRC